MPSLCLREFLSKIFHLLCEQAKTISRDVEKDDPFISTEGSTHSKATLSVSQSLEMPFGTESAGLSRGATEMTSGDRPHTPPHQIRSTSENQDVLKRLRQEKQRTKSTYEPICSNIIDTTNKLLMDRLKIKRDYRWYPVTNDATKYIDELINSSDSRNEFRRKLQLLFVPSDETYSFSKHYEIHWVHRFADKLRVLFGSRSMALFMLNPSYNNSSYYLDHCFLKLQEIRSWTKTPRVGSIVTY
ncbi:hypothetical protein C1646_406911 [Rhizophagus diaphanus]|nr:hypothetical protein C1646_406911 [Rhizophagus diaphanus] [Rhizophagus sp. MUCL 43196]